MLDTIGQEKRLDCYHNDQRLMNQKRQVKLKTCADIYNHWRSYKRQYKKAPKDGVEFQIDYIDTGLALDKEERSRAPIALALHGAPGSYHDFSLLINHLTKQKVRVIAPNFPEYIATVKTKVLFRHSADEKASYLRDFLKAIQVSKIDLLISHSSAIFPTLLILLNANNEAIERQRQQKQQQNEADTKRCIEKSETSRKKSTSKSSGGGGGDRNKKRSAGQLTSQDATNEGIPGARSFSGIGSHELESNQVPVLVVDKGNSGEAQSGDEPKRNHTANNSEVTIAPTIGRGDQQQKVAALAPAGYVNGETGNSEVHQVEEEATENNETFEDAVGELDGNNNNQCTIDISAEQSGNEPDHNHDDNDDESEDDSHGSDDERDKQLNVQQKKPIHKEEEEEGGNVAEDNEGELPIKDQVSLMNGTKLPPKKTNNDSSAKRKRRSKHNRSKDVVVKFDEPIEIKAVALFNPAGHRLPKSMKPTWFKCGSVHIYQHKFGRSLFRKFGPAFLTVVGVPVRVDNMDNVMLSATVMRNSKCQRVVSQLEQLSQMRIPTLLVFSENDKLIEREIFYEMTQFMRLDQSKFDVFNNDGDIELSQSLMDDWIRVMVFKAGGHYAYSNYAKTVNKAVSELLNKVNSNHKCSN